MENTSITKNADYTFKVESTLEGNTFVTEWFGFHLRGYKMNGYDTSSDNAIDKIVIKRHLLRIKMLLNEKITKKTLKPKL